jgi:hypothetical protein
MLMPLFAPRAGFASSNAEIGQCAGRVVPRHVDKRAKTATVLPPGVCDPGTRLKVSLFTCKKYWRIVCSGTTSRRKIMKNTHLPSIRSGFTLRAIHGRRGLECMHALCGPAGTVQRSCWQPNMATRRRDAGPPGPPAGRNRPRGGNVRYVFCPRPHPHQKSFSSHRSWGPASEISN